MKECNIQELRQLRGYTQKQVAERTNLSVDYISMIECGKRRPSDRTKSKLAQIYNVTEVEIFLAIQRTNSTAKLKKMFNSYADSGKISN